MNIITQELLRLLNREEVKHELILHRPTHTSAESALARNESLEVGAKALVLKTGSGFCIVVLSASKKLESRKAKVLFAGKKIRFATKEELFELTGLNPGSVPPFGYPLLPFKLIIDLSITKLPYVAFNAGSLEISIKMSVSDYLNVSKGELADVT